MKENIVGNNIKWLRSSKGLSQAAFAELLQIKRDNLANWELDRSKPKTEDLLKISNYFKIDMNALLTSDLEKAQQEPLISTIFNELLYKKVISSQTDFADKLGKSKGYISQLMNGNEPLPDVMKEKIHEVFGISTTYMNTGVGDMFVEEPAENYEVKEGKRREVIALGKQVPLRLKPEQYADAFGDWKGLPMYNVEVTASFVESYRDEHIFQPQYYLHDPRFKDCDFGAIVTGDSMHSEIRHGDWIMCKEIKDRRFIVYGDIYYVVASNGLETCKYINADPNEANNLLLVPRNERISPSPIPKDMIIRLFRVRGILRGY